MQTARLTVPLGYSEKMVPFRGLSEEVSNLLGRLEFLQTCIRPLGGKLYEIEIFYNRAISPECGSIAARGYTDFTDTVSAEMGVRARLSEGAWVRVLDMKNHEFILEFSKDDPAT